MISISKWLLGLILLVLLGCEARQNQLFYQGEEIKIRIMGDVTDGDYISINGYKLIHELNDTTVDLGDYKFEYLPDFFKLQIDQDSVISVPPSIYYMPMGERWMPHPNATGTVAINLIKAFNIVSKTYQDQSVELIGSSVQVAMNSTIHLKTKSDKPLRVELSPNYPALVQVLE